MNRSSVFSLFMLLALGLLLTNCQPTTPPQPSRNLVFKLAMNAGGQPFGLSKNYTAPDGKCFYVEEFKFYLSHIKLVKNDKTETEIKDVAIFTFSDPLTLTLNLNADAGNYVGIKFGVGVDSIQNLTLPQNVPNTPLSADYDMYWSMLKYRFVVLDGHVDTASTGACNSFLNTFSYHTGTNPLYRMVSLSNHPFTIQANSTNTITLNADLMKVFYGSTTTIDFKTQSGTQTTDQPYIAKLFSDNFAQIFSY